MALQRPVRPEHLVDLIIEADAIRREAMGGAPARYKPSQRVVVEPIFNALGWLFGSALRALPWPIRRRTDLAINLKLSGHPAEDNPALPSVTAEAVSLAKQLQATSGQWPAFLVLTSHPETTGPLEWLRFEVLRQGMIVANAVVEAERPGAWFRSAPQCFLAIDPYALDTVTPAVGGFYAGWMNRMYIAWDRQPSTQSWLQRHLLLRRSTYPVIAWRLIERLRKNPVLMMASGGLPHNARMLYGAREFVQRLKLAKRSLSKREAEHQLLKILMQPVNGERAAEQGAWPNQTREAVREWLGQLGVPAAETPAVLAELEEEFRPAVPHRARMLRVLIHRLVQKGRPLMLLAATHRDTPPHIHLNLPVAIVRTTEGLRVVEANGAESALTDVRTFAKAFAEKFR